MENISRYLWEHLINRGQRKNGPALLDSFSHDCLHYILSSPTKILQTFNEAVANIRQNTQKAKNNLKKYYNGDFSIDYNLNFAKLRSQLRTLLALSKVGATDYVIYETPNGNITFRLGEHNAKGDNFSDDTVNNISVYVAYHEYEVAPSQTKYEEYKIQPTIFEENKETIIKSIINGVTKILKGEDFEMDEDLSTKKTYPENNE